MENDEVDGRTWDTEEESRPYMVMNKESSPGIFFFLVNCTFCHLD